MHNESVAWLEGMFLRPHHMQAAERSIGENSRQQVALDHGYNYGIKHISFSRDAIANGQFELSECQARLRDGTVIWIDSGQQPDRVDLAKAGPAAKRSLSDAFDKMESIDVFLAVPKLRLGRANTQAESGGQHRFIGLPGTVADENAGGNEQEISLRALNVQLLLGSDNLAGYETLPIARIKRSGAAESAPELDDEYIPPVLGCDAWPELARDYVRAVYDIIGQKLDVLSSQVNTRGIMQGAPEAGDINRLLMLTALNSGFASLRSLAFANGVHPHSAYTELCRIVGSLSIFRADRRPGDIPVYDHDDLARIFRWVREEIRSLITEVQEYKFERRDFIGAGRGQEVSLDQKWMGQGWEWYIGVQYDRITSKQCRDFLVPGRLDWKLGKSEKVDFMFRYRQEGLKIAEAKPPRALPQSDNWLFYSVNKSGPAWEELRADDSPRLGVRFKESLITNLESLQGKKELQINVDGIEGTLRLSLFAVPNTE
ncbi:type VI secretion system baseplate subunit TssK [Stieleria sp. TO1_6]|uniref:type VI secretion system baseplate subunit TssK n=1 Tax=Stieleria tagensis TaxID=2956795 RepID=UPI00209BB89D|nr:type VI secretion system baseplate subunit TssK [Stieleria tagensis]MCO8121104.1 type VI secretion system baseplate subunit TssK [Stieleria tagensis]